MGTDNGNGSGYGWFPGFGAGAYAGWVNGNGESLRYRLDYGGGEFGTYGILHPIPFQDPYWVKARYAGDGE